jgi:uncharacterized protein (DUF885 family)
MTLTPRQLADQYVDEMARLNPIIATMLGLSGGQDRLCDLSPAGLAAADGLERRTLAELEEIEQAAGGVEELDPAERVCARLLRERLTASLALAEAGERLADLDTLQSPMHDVRRVLNLMPAATPADWAAIGRRIRAIPEALAQYQATLTEGMAQGRSSGPMQAPAVVVQLNTWLGEPGGASWFTEFVGAGPEELRDELTTAAAQANAGVARFRDWLRDEYGPWTVEHGTDPVGRERYRRFARFWNGADLDLDEAYRWAWAEFAQLDAEIRAEAERVLPGADPAAAMNWLNEHGPAVDGVEAVRAWLQKMMDDAVTALDGEYFDLAAPVRRVEAMIAPAGSAAAPYYTTPSMDFARPGQTWLPTLGRTRFPIWELVSTWYHEGVPGHHLQLAQWVLKAPELSRYQTTLGLVSANVEGWALYAERLMDELGFLGENGARIGYLDAQRFRAVRVIVDIGMHLELEIPLDQGTPEPFAPGERWTPALVRQFLGANSGRPAGFLDSELIRYLGMPGQAIGYKLGERAWLAGRDAATAAHAGRGERLDPRAWHMAALSAGSLGLDDLVAELASLPGGS